jgi:hypothetical protein
MVKATKANCSEILFTDVSCGLECDVVWFCKGLAMFCDACEFELMVLQANSCNSLWCCRPTAVTAYGAAGQQL